jgi:CrcB protein
MLEYLWVAVGGAIGSVARFWMSGALTAKYGDSFSIGTLTVNVLGSLLIGFLAALSSPDGRWVIPAAARHFLIVGVCGGYTTFSAFSLQTFHLIQNRDWVNAGGNILFSVALCLLGVWIGFILGTALNAKGV